MCVEFAGCVKPDTHLIAQTAPSEIIRRMEGQLYSGRTGRPRTLDLRAFVTLVWRAVIIPLRDEGLLVQALQPGKIATDLPFSGPRRDVDLFLLERLRSAQIKSSDLLTRTTGAPVVSSVDVIFDLLELLHQECVSAPASKTITSYGDTVYGRPFDQAQGQQRLRKLTNPVLAQREPPLEMQPNGHIIELPASAIQALVDEPIPDSVDRALRDPIEAAIERFYRRGATDVDRRDALRHLADFLEHQRAIIKTEMLSKDENDLFRIANQFAIRHHRQDQQGDYDKDIWQEWTFHVFLATAKALIQVHQRDSAVE